MVMMLERPVAKDAPKSGRKPAPKAPEPDEVGEEDVAPILVAREIAEWVTDVSVYATRKAKKERKLQGRKRVSNATIVDAFLREMVWELRQRCLNPAHPVGSPPPPAVPPVPVDLP